MIKFSENQSAPKLENRKTSPCSPCSPNILHVLVSRILGYHNLCLPALSKPSGQAFSTPLPPNGKSPNGRTTFYKVTSWREKAYPTPLSVVIFCSHNKSSRARIVTRQKKRSGTISGSSIVGKTRRLRRHVCVFFRLAVLFFDSRHASMDFFLHFAVKISFVIFLWAFCLCYFFTFPNYGQQWENRLNGILAFQHWERSQEGTIARMHLLYVSVKSLLSSWQCVCCQ